jgi:MraZ protein
MDMLRQRLNRFNAEHQRIFRQFVSEVEVVMLDGNGRFLIPKRYMLAAGIQQSVEFIGMGDTIEIWSAEKVEASKMSGEEFGKALENIMNISF